MTAPNSLKILAAGWTLLACFATASAIAAAPLIPGKPIPVANSHGGFDFIEVDQGSSRLLGPHTRNGTFDLFQLPIGKLLKQVQVGKTQSVAVDAKAGKYYLAGSEKPRLVTLDMKSLDVNGETTLPGPADIMAFDPRNHAAYVCHDDGTEVWVVDVVSQKIIATITIPEGPEGIVYDPTSDRLFVNVKATSEVVVIDPTANKVVANWSTAPADKPHGLAIDPQMHRLFAAGANGQLVEIDCVTGKVVGSAKIALKVDQVAYDPELKQIYAASGTGVVSVVLAKESGLEALGDVPTHAGAHSVAVDFKTHTVWTAYGDDSASYILSLKTPKE